MHRLWVFAIAFAAGACWTCALQPKPIAPSDAGTADAGESDGGDGGPDAGGDAGPGCGDPLASPEMSCGTLAWTKSPINSRLRNHQFSFIAPTDAGPFLYVLGGFEGASETSGYFDNVDIAPIASDGSLGAFAGTTPMKLAVGGLLGGLVGNVVVVAGGHAPSGVTDESYSAIIQGDGSLSPWQDTGSTLHPRMHGGAVVVGDTIYVLGGFDGASKVWNDVVSATVHPDGTLSAWTSAGTLPQPLSHFSVVRVGNRVYLAGGLNRSALQNPPELNSVYQGTFGADGTLGNWTNMTHLPLAVATHASFVYGGRLYVAGGINDTPAQEDGVWSAPIQGDGTLGAWQAEASLLIKRGHVHQLPLFGDHLYSVAGAIDFQLDSTGEIDIGAFE